MTRILDQFNPDDLLDLVEGNLPPERDQALRAQLAADPQAVRALEEMQSQRAALRGLPSPTLPRDLVAGVEMHLLRPMLMDEPEAEFPVAETTPGSYRRAHRRRQGVGRWWPAGLAAAAVLMAAVGAGIWGMASGLLRPGDPDRARIVARDGDGPESGDLSAESAVGEAPADAPSSQLPPDAIVHHHLPLPDERSTALARADDASTAEPLPGVSPEPRVVSFALVVPVAEPEQYDPVEQALVKVLVADPQAALVRNFSFEEAARLLDEAHRAQGPRQPTPPAIAGLSPEERRRLELQRTDLEILRRHIREARRGREGQEPDRPSEQLVGSERIAAALQLQIELSERGATHAITIRKDRLHELLADVAATLGPDAVLRAIPDEPAPGEADAREQADDTAATWAAERRVVQAALAELETLPDDALLILPVVIDAPQGDARPPRRSR